MFPYLRQKGKRQRPKEVRVRFKVGKTISQRPKEIKNRQEFGRWEADTVVSSQVKSKGCIATFAERKSCYYFCCLILDCSSHSMKEAMYQLIHTFSESALKTITVDRGKEFSCYKGIESQFNVDIYFAGPYSAWQRGTNENSNGLLRGFFPQRTDLAKVTQEELNYALNVINHRPRKCLNWDTLCEILNLEVLRLN
ncbi:IS30 family transposase [Staphylococcus argensis]